MTWSNEFQFSINSNGRGAEEILGLYVASFFSVIARSSTNETYHRS